MELGLLAHLTRHFARGSENVASDALVYLLNTYDAARTAMLDHVRSVEPALPEIVRYRAQHPEPSGGFVDIAGQSREGFPLFIEVKFDAGLTARQPSAYLDALRKVDGPSMLLFVVPHRRVGALWGRLERECASRGTVRGRGVLQICRTTLTITSWGSVLDALTSTEDGQLANEVAQLRGLVHEEDRNMFTPLDRETLSAGAPAVNDLAYVIDEVLRTVEERHLGRASRWFAEPGSYGRYLDVDGRKLSLYINFARWGAQAPTPLWLAIPASPAVESALAPLAEGSELPRHFLGEKLQVALNVGAGLERSELLEALLAQLTEIFELLRAVPTGSASAAPSDDVIDGS